MGIINFNITNTYKCQTQKFSSISLSVDNKLVESPSSFALIKLQRLLRTSEPSALERKVLERAESHFITKDHLSTESSLNSWPKVEISPLETELVESQSTV